MRLGCAATAVDINPVAWFILKCTLEYPQRLAGQTRPLPVFVLQDRDFMEAFLKDRGFRGAALQAQLDRLGLGEEAANLPLPGVAPDVDLEADLAWHVRAWGRWALERARRDLARFYPTVDGKPTVAYLWARTVTCKNCRATIPLLKTRWLVKKPRKRVVLTMEPNADRTGVVFGIQDNPPRDKQVGDGTMSRSGATCPCCGAIMTMHDIRLEGQAERLGARMTAVVVDSNDGKEYRLPTQKDLQAAVEAENGLKCIFAEIPDGIPEEPLPSKDALGFRVPLYGFDKWRKLFLPRQLLALGTFVKHTREVRDTMRVEGYPLDWVEAVTAYLALAIDRLADAGSSIAHWQVGGEFNVNTFQRFALPVSWDFAEVSSTSGSTGSYEGALNWIASVCTHLMESIQGVPSPVVILSSATQLQSGERFDAIVTDPPYYSLL
jgi:adenine-specific DNA methylase